MATEVLIPKLCMTAMTEGTVAERRVADGAPVTAGERPTAFETEKIEFEVEAEASGILRQLVPEGTTPRAPGVTVAFILAEGEALPAGVPEVARGQHHERATRRTAAAAGRPREGGRTPASPAARRLAAERGLDISTVAGTGPGGRVTEADVLAARDTAAAQLSGLRSRRSAGIAARPAAGGTTRRRHHPRHWHRPRAAA
ncbi:MAG: E3 binding domain-containing protein [Dehalococcoidia bacterium]